MMLAAGEWCVDYVEWCVMLAACEWCVDCGE